MFERLAPEEQARVPRVLLQLVRPGEGTQDTKRVAARDEVGEENWELVARLASVRLVVCSRDEPSSAETVEFVHEALIGGWERLRAWLDADRKYRSCQERLRAALHQWEATAKPDDALLRGVLLAEGEEALAERSEDLSEQEEAFIKASLALRDRQRVERERGRRRALMALAGGLVAAMLLAVTAVAQWWRADVAGRVAVGRQLAAQSELLRSQQASLLAVSVLLAVESVRRLGDSPGLEADQALRHGLAILPRQIAALPHDPSPGAPLFSSDNRALVASTNDGRYLATAGLDRTVRLWDARTAAPAQSIAHTRDVLAVALSPDGRQLATAAKGGRVQVWEVPSGRTVVALVPPTRPSRQWHLARTDGGCGRGERPGSALAGRQLAGYR